LSKVRGESARGQTSQEANETEGKWARGLIVQGEMANQPLGERARRQKSQAAKRQIGKKARHPAQWALIDSACIHCHCHVFDECCVQTLSYTQTPLFCASSKTLEVIISYIIISYICYLCQGGYVFARLCLSVCLFVCLCVSKITQKDMDGSFWNFEGMSGMA